jgi:plasmid stabilization system protein ParE
MKRYVSRDKPEAARDLAESINKSVLRLLVFPLSGRAVPEFPGSDLREVIVAPYRVVYQPRGLDIVVLRVWHGMRSFNP